MKLSSLLGPVVYLIYKNQLASISGTLNAVCEFPRKHQAGLRTRGAGVLHKGQCATGDRSYKSQSER